MVSTVRIPLEFVETANHWHGGQSTMLYAVSSRGELTSLYTRPYDEDRCRELTDPEWEVYLWEKLAAELRDTETRAANLPSNYITPAGIALVVRFREFAEQTANRLAAEYGVEI